MLYIAPENEETMTITFNYEVSSRPNRLGCYVIYLRVTQDRKPKRIKTGVELPSLSDWNPKKQRVRTSNINHRKYNDMLETILVDAREKYNELRKEGIATSERIISAMTDEENPQSFFDYAEKAINDIYSTGGIRNAGAYRLMVNKLKEYRKRRDLYFRDLTPALLVDFEAFLRTQTVNNNGRKGLHPNTVRAYMAKFRALINRAIKIDRVMKIEQNPFLSYTLKGVKTTKEKLIKEEIERIINLKLDEGSELWHTRNYFLFSYYCAGIRIGDLMSLKWSNITGDGRLIYQMGKNHKERDLRLVGKAQAILQYYNSKDYRNAGNMIFPILDATKPYINYISISERDTMRADMKKQMYCDMTNKVGYLNRLLRKIAELARIEKKVTFHVARHSFARVAKQMGTDNLVLQNLLAHSSIGTTEVYMGNFDTSESDTALEHIFGEDSDREKSNILERLQRYDIDTLKYLLTIAEQKKSPK